MAVDFTLNEYMVFIDELVKWEQGFIYGALTCSRIKIMKSPEIKKTSYIEFMSIRAYGEIEESREDIEKILNSAAAEDKVFASRMKTYFNLGEDPNVSNLYFYQDLGVFTSDAEVYDTLVKLQTLCKNRYKNVVMEFEYPQL